jgi:hypothetical protein
MSAKVLLSNPIEDKNPRSVSFQFLRFLALQIPKHLILTLISFIFLESLQYYSQGISD